MITINTQTLNIKPIKTYPKNSGRNTTITGFDEILNGQKDKVSSKKSKEVAKKAKKTANNIEYKDPITGKIVNYVDISESSKKNNKKANKEETTETNDKNTVNNNSKKEVKKSSSKSSVKTVTASSMKKTKYNTYFQDAAKKYNISESLLKAIAKAESDFDPNCLSSSGAMGIMQLMPETARELGVDDPYDPQENIMGGAKCIAQKLEEFNGNVRLALAAYNAGSGAVRRAGGVPSYCNTYVNRVISYKEAYETAEAVG